MEHLITEIPDSLSKLENFIKAHESAHELKEGAEAQIIWADSSSIKRTEYAIVYLHGFRASHPEGDPVHKAVAQKLGCNLYLSRLAEHGIKSQYPLFNLTEKSLLKSAHFAFEIGKRIGKKIILMGTSTGGSLALYLASHPEHKDRISSLVLYSPLIQFFGIKQQLLTSTAIRKLLSIVPGKKHLITNAQSTYAEDRIWNKKYTLGGVLALGAFVQHHMRNELFKQVQQPAFIGYYYKNRKEQDTVVSVQAIKRMAKKLDSRTAPPQVVNFPNAKNHVICSSLLSKSVENVIDHTSRFLKDLGTHRTTGTH
ncbi:alpha/beta hydrolase [Fodinibius halophilus]|uniref:Alpha/beta hydrolase n=1 Tax=Fodinibius halophilus TaxID=1736908 RepID=A0A6M1T508_9BACT|nr:alpha/beta hydrolase [Fodinibius halophilus]NGP89127.1 alpha/beta hydrolase [Fodinibius halophilus]